MKGFLLLSTFFFSILSAYSQAEPSWTISLNKKELLSATEENEQKNIVIVKTSDFKAGTFFIITYKEINTGHSKNEWRRITGIYTVDDKELTRKDTAVLKLNTSQVKKWLLENKIIKVYSWSLPKDPKEAARVRVRRVHLCTIMLKL